jgi:hypothetical protein
MIALKKGNAHGLTCTFLIAAAVLAGTSWKAYSGTDTSAPLKSESPAEYRDHSCYTINEDGRTQFHLDAGRINNKETWAYIQGEEANNQQFNMPRPILKIPPCPPGKHHL